MKFLVINGPNLNMLGIREPDIYGRQTYSDLEKFVSDACRDAGVECEIFQSNHEGSIVDHIQQAFGNIDGIVINPAAYTHTSVAILDALKPLRCICPMSASVRRSGRCHMRAWPASKPTWGSASRATGRR